MLLVFSTCAFALDPSLDISQYAHTAWRVRDGFGEGPMHSIAQTSDGYLWLGTESGLLRFDGVRAVPWQPPGNEHLPNSVVMRLLASHDGTLWIATGKGLASWKDGKLIQYPELTGWIGNALLEDHEGTVWVGGFGIPGHGRLCAIKNGQTQCSDPGEGVQSIYEDSRKTLWVSTFKGLWRWKPGLPEFFPTGATFTSALIEDTDGRLLIGKANGIQRFVNGKSEAHPVEMLAREFGVDSFLWDHDGGLWVGSFAGLVHFHRGRAELFRQVDGLSANTVHCVFEDREGNIWVATEGGLDRFRDVAVPTFSAKDGFPDGFYGPILADKDGSLWFSNSDTLSKWKNSEVSVHDRLDPRNNAGGVTAVRKIHDIGLRRQVRGLFQDSRGRLWVLAVGGFGYMNNDKFVLVKAVPGETKGSIAEGANGDMWFSYENALFHSVEGGSKVEPILWTKLHAKEGGGRIAFDPMQGGLWIGLPQGGIAYFRHGQIERSYTTADGTGEGRITHLRVDLEGSLWASTEGGLSRIKDGKVATLSAKNGLPCNAVHWSEEDTDHSVWVYLECGLVRVDASEMSAWIADPNRTVRMTLLDSSDGVTAKSAIFGGFSSQVTKSSDGKLWFSVENGISVVDPHHLPFNKLSPPVQIERVIADGKTYWQNLPGEAPSHTRLPPLVRDIAIDYTGLSLGSPEKVQFRFKLEGQDKDWRKVVNERRVQYSNLTPGNYHFRVIACNNSGVWNEAGTFLDFNIAPAYYQTNWFRALCMLAFLAMLWTVYQLRVRALERRQVLLEQNQSLLKHHQSEIRALNDQLIKAQEAERIRISGELHDGVLQQITSLTLRLGTVKYQVPADSEAKTAIVGLQQDLIKIGTDVRQVSHELHPALLHEQGLPAALSSYCEEFSKVRGLPVSCETDESVKELSPGAALCLYRIAQEALGNAAKHSAAKKVEVRLTRSDDRVWLSVSDDGVGCTPDQVAKSGGLGLINMRERLLQLNGKFDFESSPGQGTTVRVAVPYRATS